MRTAWMCFIGGICKGKMSKTVLVERCPIKRKKNGLLVQRKGARNRNLGYKRYLSLAENRHLPINFGLKGKLGILVHQFKLYRALHLHFHLHLHQHHHPRLHYQCCLYPKGKVVHRRLPLHQFHQKNLQHLRQDHHHRQKESQAKIKQVNLQIQEAMGMDK